MIFDGRYKLIENHNDINELFDHQEDPHELVNIIQDYPDLAKRLMMSMQLLRK